MADPFVYLASDRATVAHRRADCAVLARRPAWCAGPLRLRVVGSRPGFVSVVLGARTPRQVERRLCRECGGAG